MEESDCPLCCEPFDATDLAFTPCPCGYKVCVWCYHRLKDDTDGQCPACRQRYREVENLTGHYIFLLGSYRALYILNWIYRYFTEFYYSQWLVWLEDSQDLL